jgi:hypothetical protein
VHLEAKNPLLTYKGAVKINHECNQLAESWVNFESEIDPKSIYIPINDQPMEINGAFLVSGTMMATDSVHIYPAFISPRKITVMFLLYCPGLFYNYDAKEKI